MWALQATEEQRACAGGNTYLQPCDYRHEMLLLHPFIQTFTMLTAFAVLAVLVYGKG